MSALGLFVTRRSARERELCLPPTPRFAQGVDIFIFLLTGLVGGTMFLLPGVGLGRWPWDLSDAINAQLLGAIFLTVAIRAGWV